MVSSAFYKRIIRRKERPKALLATALTVIMMLILHFQGTILFDGTDSSRFATLMTMSIFWWVMFSIIRRGYYRVYRETRKAKDGE